jgi:hypothetical protein
MGQANTKTTTHRQRKATVAQASKVATEPGHRNAHEVRAASVLHEIEEACR